MAEPKVVEVGASADERARMNAVRALLGKAPAQVRVQVGQEKVELPRALVRILLAAAKSLHDGDTVAVVSEEAEISPSQAAKLLGVSRQYVDHLLANDLLPCRRLPGSAYRKIPVRAVLAYKQTRDRKRQGIRRLVAAATEAGLEY